MAMLNRHDPTLTGHQHTITLGDIMTSYELGLVMIAGQSEDTFETPVQWVHTSDLNDPTPFLTPRTVLLTTGSQYVEDASNAYASEYVERLVDAGVSALGFAVEILHDRIPQSLVTACDEQCLPLFRVPYDTPFIAVTQMATRQLAAINYQQERWSFDTQRAISRAALRRLGLTAAVDELAERLGRWVTLSNARGILIHASETAPSEHGTAPWIIAAIEKIGSRGTRANVTRQHRGESVHLQTIAGTTGIQGILVVESTIPLSPAEHSAIEQVATLAALHFEQHRQLSSGRSQLKSAVLTLLLNGETETAHEVSDAFQHHLPENDMYVLYLGDTSSLSNDLFEQLQAFASQLTEVLLGSNDETLILVTPPRHRARITAFCASLGIRAGLSTKHSIDDITIALGEARSAYRHTSLAPSGTAVHVFNATMSEDVTSLLFEHPEASTRALQLLRPLTDHDAKHGESLTETLGLWLEHHGQNSATAVELGVHRHTVASRMKLAGELLGRNLEDPHDRAELLVALTLVDSRTDPNLQR